jgi:TPR repeat protein
MERTMRIAKILPLIIASALSANLAYANTDQDTDALPLCETAECTSDFKKLRNFAINGSSEAASLLAIAYANGEGVSQDDAYARKFMLRAIKWKDPFAIHQASRWYRTGHIFDKDVARADELLNRVVDRGFPPALVDKAKQLFAENNKNSDKLAFDLLIKAKESTYLPAYELLAVFYEHGIGTEASLYQSAKMHKTLAIRGHEGAQEKLDKLVAIIEQQNINIDGLKVSQDIERLDPVLLDVHSEIKDLIAKLKTTDYDGRSTVSRIQGQACSDAGNGCYIQFNRNSPGMIPNVVTGTIKGRFLGQ